MTRSLSRRLIGILSAVVLAAWVTTAFFSYLDARQRIDDVLDGNLQRSAVLLAALAQTSGSGTIVATDDTGIAFRVVDDAGRLLLRSPGFPAMAVLPTQSGFTDIQRSDGRWRIYGWHDSARGVVVQVAELYAPRAALAASVASHLLHPVWIALPLLAGMIWLAIRWGLAPLLSLARQVQSRQPGNLAVLDQGAAPREVVPLIDALNALFLRVTALLERERRFAADAAHELRTPLAAIRMNAEVARAARDDTGRDKAMADVVRGTGRAARLIDQLLLLARLEPEGVLPATQRVTLAEAAARAIADCATLAAAGDVDLGLSAGDGGDMAVNGSADLLTTMIRNLVDNAVRYSGTGGAVDVTLRRGAGTVALTVADNGPGLRAGDRERIFDRFYRGLGSGQEGSGLGLSIVARIAELHDATIAVGAGVEGRGLAVTVTFPAADRTL